MLGFVILIKGADLLVDGASAIAKRLDISDLAIGLTVVAFGTSTPELAVNILASASGNTDLAIGNVLGSNIANVLLILGVSAAIYPLTVSDGTVRKEIPLSLLAVLVLGLMANDHGIDGDSLSRLTRSDGLVLLGFFSIFLYYSFGISRQVDGFDEHLELPERSLAVSVSLVLGGLIGLTVGARWIVEGAVAIATRLGMSESLVGLTIVAIGTSLPELATSAMAAYRKNVDIAVGNVVGSNIFNIFFVLGISSTIKPLPFQSRSNFDLGVVLVSSLLLFLTMWTGRRRTLDRWEGVVLLAGYVGYLALSVARG
ncbi:MAG: calcium/sodium antiporter [Acidobacteriota bacterium]